MVCNRYINEDGEGGGTIIKIGSSGETCKVKWDHDGSEYWYNQGSNGLFSLKLTTRNKKLPEMLFKDKEFVDAKIICEGKTFECHKNVLGCQSDVFAAMFLNNSMNEAKSGVVEIDDFEVEVIETMIYFIYNDKILDKKKYYCEFVRSSWQVPN